MLKHAIFLKINNIYFQVLFESLFLFGTINMQSSNINILSETSLFKSWF